MPQLSSNQQEQAIGRSKAGHSAQIIAYAYNINIRTIYHLQHRYNSTNDHPTQWSSPSHHTTTRSLYSAPTSARRFTKTTETGHTTGTQQRPISANTVRRCLASNNFHCRRPARGSILTNHHRNDCNGPQLVNISAISNGEESSSQMKVSSVF